MPSEYKFHKDLTGLELHPPGVHEHVIGDVSDIVVVSPLPKQLLEYDNASGKWKNKTITDLLLFYSVNNEVPTKVSSKVFTTASAYLAGSMEVYLNGIKERYITEDTETQFSFLADTQIDDYVEVSYIKKP